MEKFRKQMEEVEKTANQADSEFDEEVDVADFLDELTGKEDL